MCTKRTLARLIDNDRKQWRDRTSPHSRARPSEISVTDCAMEFPDLGPPPPPLETPTLSLFSVITPERCRMWFILVVVWLKIHRFLVMAMDCAVTKLLKIILSRDMFVSFAQSSQVQSYWLVQYF